MNLINKLMVLLCLVGVVAYAETVTPFNNTASSAKQIKDVGDINADNIQAFFKNSAPVKPLKLEPIPSPIAKLHSGPAIYLMLGVPASLAESVRADMSGKQGNPKINFSGEDAPINAKPVAVAAIKNPLLQNATSMTNAMPPAVWLLGVGLLGMAGISRRKKPE
jgi:hypothetical protein